MKSKPTLVLALAGFTALLQAQTSPSVAIVPIQNLSGEKWEALKQNQINKSEEYLRDQFGKRGFSLVPKTDLRDAIAELKIDFTDEEQQKRSVLFDLAKKVKADYIIFAVITETNQAQRDRTFYTDIEGKASVKIWLLNAQKETAILSAKTFVGRSGGNRLGDGKGSERQIQAAANALRDGLKDFFTDFPIR
ncbi:MAG: hypothetical protein ACOYON_03990 [Fimbriimonas sp.]